MSYPRLSCSVEFSCAWLVCEGYSCLDFAHLISLLDRHVGILSRWWRTLILVWFVASMLDDNAWAAGSQAYSEWALISELIHGAVGALLRFEGQGRLSELRCIGFMDLVCDWTQPASWVPAVAMIRVVCNVGHQSWEIGQRTGEILILDDTGVGFEREIVEIACSIWEENFYEEQSSVFASIHHAIKRCAAMYSR